MSDGTINLDLEVRTQDMALPYAGVLSLKALNKAAITNLEQGGMLSVDNHTATLILYKVETGGTLTEKARRDIPAASTDEAVDYTFYIPEAGTYRLEATAAHRMQSTWAQRPEGTPADIYPTYTLGAALGILGVTADGQIRFSGSQEATQIGTDGFYSFWSLLNYLYFSQSQGLKVKGNCIISSPNGENTLTIDDNGISLSVPAGADASEYTAVFTQASTRANIESGEKLKALFGKIKKWFADMKTVAFTGAYSDLNGNPTSLPADGGHADTADRATADADGKDIRHHIPPPAGQTNARHRREHPLERRQQRGAEPRQHPQNRHLLPCIYIRHKRQRQRSNSRTPQWRPRLLQRLQRQ